MSPARRQRPAVRRALIGLAVLGAAWFAIEGGEYGSSDLVRQQLRRRSLQADIDSLKRQVDSLERYHERLLTDPVLQERIAREQFGMVRSDKELVYRFTDAPAAPVRP